MGGVRVVSETIPDVRSVALGAFVDVGSARESKTEAGWSHLLEHMLFRGTASFTSEQIDQHFDAIGAELNAGTGRENTSVHSRVLDEHVEDALPIIAEMIWRPSLAEEALTQEREIVLEELAMYEDDPQDHVFDLLGRAVFGSHPLGRPVVGTQESVSGATASDLIRFHAEHYRPQRVVFAAAGAIEHEALVASIQQALEKAGSDDATANGRPVVPDPAAVKDTRTLAKPTEQTHIAIGAQAFSRADERRFALRVLDALLGGTSSSRLFQEVRERRGLAYSVYSFASLFGNGGEVGIYVGTRPDNAVTALDVIADQIERLVEDGPSAEEVARARENVKGRLVLSQESTSARMSRLGSALLAQMPILGVDEVLARIDAVERDDVVALLRELFLPSRFSLAAIGPDEQPVADAFARRF